MRTRSIPATDVLVAYEQAAHEISELRRRGIPCHLEEHADPGGPRIDVVRDEFPDASRGCRKPEDAGW